MTMISTLLCMLATIYCEDNEHNVLMEFDATLPARAFVIPGQNFYDHKLNFTAEEQATFKARAMCYFHKEFGLDNVEHNRNLHTMLFETNPALGMQTYFLESGLDEPTEEQDGLVNYNGGWMVRVISRNGLTLGGKHAGEFAQFGTTFSIGHWLIEGEGGEKYIWQIEDSSLGSIAQYEFGLITEGQISVWSPEWGAGTSHHRTHYSFLARGLSHAVFTNDITFPIPRDDEYSQTRLSDCDDSSHY